MAIVCASTIDHVAIYARGAVVTRSIRLPDALPDGPVDLELPGITALAEPGSLKLSLEGPRVALSVRASLVVPVHEGAGALPEKARELHHRIDRLKGEIQALEERRARLIKLTPDAWPEAIAGFDARARLALNAGKLIDEVSARLDAREFELEEALREARRKLASMNLELKQTSSAPDEAPRPTRTLLIRLGGAGKLPRAAVSYLVAPARWWPLYTLRVAEGGRAASLSIEALVAQLSGEDWSAAQLSFATADLVHDARLPTLPSLRLGRAQPPPRTGYRPPPAGLDLLFAAHDRYFPDLVPPRPIPEEDPEINYTLRDILRGGSLTEGGSRRPAAPAGNARASVQPPGGRPAMEEVEDELDDDEALTPPPSLKGSPAAETALLRTRSMGAADVPEMKKAKMDSRARLASPPSARQSAPVPLPPGLRAPAREGPPPVAAPASILVGGLLSVDAAGGGAPPQASARAGGARAAASPDDEAGLQPQERQLDFSRLRLGTAGDRHRRGRLFLAVDDARSLSAMQQIEGVVPPVSEVRDPRQSRGQFAYRYEAAARGTVPSDGVAHLVPVAVAQAPLKMSFRSVPRETQEVYREAQFANPFDAPLLTGPVQIYVDGSLLTTASIDRVAKGGVVRVGLGVEPRLRVARNVQMQEGAAGLLNGSTVVTQTVRIDFSSSLGHPAELEVLERFPVSDDKQIVVERLGSTPEARVYDQAERGEPVRGGLRWSLTLPPAGSAHIEHGFRVTLPAKFELNGGNRRD